MSDCSVVPWLQSSVEIISNVYTSAAKTAIKSRKVEVVWYVMQRGVSMQEGDGIGSTREEKEKKD